MPVRGRDLTKAGFSEGPALGEKLAEIEEAWVDSGFKLDRDALLKFLKYHRYFKFFNFFLNFFEIPSVFQNFHFFFEIF